MYSQHSNKLAYQSVDLTYDMKLHIKNTDFRDNRNENARIFRMILIACRHRSYLYYVGVWELIEDGLCFGIQRTVGDRVESIILV